MNGYKKSKDSICMGQYFDQSSIFLGLFFNDQVYDWGMFQKFGPHTRTTITP